MQETNRIREITKSLIVIQNIANIVFLRTITSFSRGFFLLSPNTNFFLYLSNSLQETITLIL